jgi:ABC-2 type transport system ATP-binding protein
MLSATGLSKQYRTSWALRPVDLELGPGMHGLLGPNGAGKSTLMRLLSGLLVPTTGDAWLDGVCVRRSAALRKRIGYVPQSFQLYPQLTAREWLHHIAKLKGIKAPAQRTAEVEHTLQSVHLEAAAGRPAKTYSSGMIKRLGIAQALIGRPDVIIVDEPTTGLDPEERTHLRNVLAEAALTRTVLLSTHIISDIQTSCRDAMVLMQGKLLYHGNLQGLTTFASGKIWTWEASEEEWRANRHPGLLSARKTTEGVMCRVMAVKRPNPYALPAEPTPHDGYLALLEEPQREALV